VSAVSDPPLPAAALTTQTAAVIAVLCLAWVARTGLSLGACYPLKAGGLFCVVTVLALGHLRGRHPFERFGPANQLTTARLVFVVLIASLPGESGRAAIARTAVAAGLGVTVLDGLDGWLARRTSMASAFGARFDMETDALLIQGLAILAWQYGKAGAWVLLSGLIRYGFVAAGRLWPWLRRPLVPTRRARAICVVQIAALLLAILPAIAPPLSATIAAVGLTLLCYSFLADTVRLWRHTALSMETAVIVAAHCEPDDLTGSTSKEDRSRVRDN
jgi:phosphatidylglycerophosphate synthase